MGRKVDMKKIEDITKCQVTFSKRRSSLMKKANEIAVCCEVDVAFITFSPSGRVSKYCNKKRIEEVLFRYVNLTTDKRYAHISNIQEKQEKIRQLDHIKNDTSKLQYLDKQIENLELQNKKCALELQILEADMRDFEPFSEQEPSLHQLMWCEKNLKQSLRRVLNRKNVLLSGCPSSSQKQPIVEGNNNIGTMEVDNNRAPTENPPIENVPGQLLMQLDPWISPYSAKVRESIFQDLVEGELELDLPPITFPNQLLTDNNLDFTTNMETDYQQLLQPLPNGIETFDYQFMNFSQDNNIVDIPNIHSNSNVGLNYVDNSYNFNNNNSMPSSSNVNQPPYAVVEGNTNLPMYESYNFNSMPSMNPVSGSTWFNPYNSNEISNHEDFGFNTNNNMVPHEDNTSMVNIVSGSTWFNPYNSNEISNHQNFGFNTNNEMIPHEGPRGLDNITTTLEVTREDEKVMWNGGIPAASLWEWEDMLNESFNGDDLARL